VQLVDDLLFVFLKINTSQTIENKGYSLLTVESILVFSSAFTI